MCQNFDRDKLMEFTCPLFVAKSFRNILSKWRGVSNVAPDFHVSGALWYRILNRFYNKLPHNVLDVWLFVHGNRYSDVTENEIITS